MSNGQSRANSRNVLSTAGALLTTAAAVVFIAVLLGDLFGLHANPYLGAVFFLILPALFVIGLILIPIGTALERRRRRKGLAAADWPRIDLNEPRHRQRALAILALTAVNVLIVSLAAYNGVEYMDSNSFCGQVCHVPMKPEFVAHQAAPHASVPCVACHVAPGASGLVGSKFAGVRRLRAQLAGSFARPIPPVADPIPARDTCERCHWPETRHGEVTRQVAEYAADEANTETVTTVRLRVGGGPGRPGAGAGIHWHASGANQIEYVATGPDRETIPYVLVKDRTGASREYFAPGATTDQIANGRRRRMDCVDCHNRPAHPIASSADRAVDRSIALGEIPNSLPFIKREAVRALEAGYASDASAMDRIGSALGDFYKSAYPAVAASRQADVEQAVRAVRAIFQINVFPEMNVTFGTYPSHIGHIESPGCFRCHDAEKATKDGKTIGQDCELCHSID